MDRGRSISSEVLGLIQEITEDPRAAIRLVPRKPLLDWFAEGEVLRPSDVSRDRAARHLVAAHREELAELLYDAARIAYWKKPSMSHVPLDSSGRPSMPSEQTWRKRASWEVEHESEPRQYYDLLRQCLDGVRPEFVSYLAAASLALVPRDDARLYLAHGIKRTRPRSSLALFERVVEMARTSLTKAAALSGMGSRLCAIGLLEEALAAYRSEIQCNTDPLLPWISVFNLSCILGHDDLARTSVAELSAITDEHDLRVAEALRVNGNWLRSQGESIASAAKATTRMISDKLFGPAQKLSAIYELQF